MVLANLAIPLRLAYLRRNHLEHVKVTVHLQPPRKHDRLELNGNHVASFHCRFFS